MSIEVTCPSCQATLPLPKNFTGKKIRCSDCNGIVEVTLANAPQAAVAKAVRKPELVDEERPSRRRRDADDEDEAPRRKPRRNRDDEDDRPRRENERGFPKVWLAVIGVVGVAILITGMWVLISGGAANPPGVPPVPIAVAPEANPLGVVANPAANGQMNNFAPVNVGQQNAAPIDGWEHEIVPNQPKK